MQHDQRTQVLRSRRDDRGLHDPHVGRVSQGRLVQDTRLLQLLRQHPVGALGETLVAAELAQDLLVGLKGTELVGHLGQLRADRLRSRRCGVSLGFGSRELRRQGLVDGIAALADGAVLRARPVLGLSTGPRL